MPASATPQEHQPTILRRHYSSTKLILLVSIAYLLFGVWALPYAEFLYDDLVTYNLALGIIDGSSYPLFWGGGMIIPHGALSAYLYAPALLFSRSPSSLFYAQLFVTVAAHVVLMLYFKKLRAFEFGAVCSLLLFFNPFFSSFHAQTIWQLSAITPFVIVFLFSIFLLQYSWELRYELLAAASLGLAAQCHEIVCLLYIPALLTMLWQRGRQTPNSLRLILISAASLSIQGYALYRVDERSFYALAASALMAFSCFAVLVRAKVPPRTILALYVFSVLIFTCVAAWSNPQRFSECFRLLFHSIESLASYNLPTKKPYMLQIASDVYGHTERVLLVWGFVVAFFCGARRTDALSRFCTFSAVVCAGAFLLHISLGTFFLTDYKIGHYIICPYYPLPTIVLAYGIYSFRFFKAKWLGTLLLGAVLAAHAAASIFQFNWTAVHGRPTFNNPLLGEREFIAKTLNAQPCVRSVAFMNTTPSRGYPSSWYPFMPAFDQNCKIDCVVYVAETDGSCRHCFEEVRESLTSIAQNKRVSVGCSEEPQARAGPFVIHTNPR